MPRLEERGVPIYSVPGIVPGLLGIVILLLGLILLVRAARAGGYRLSKAGARNDNDKRGVRLTLTLLITLGYALGLIGNLPYWLATALFVFAFIAVFEWENATAAAHLRRLSSALLQAGIVALIVSVVFEKVFLVRLP